MQFLFQSAISNIANWKYSNTLSKDKCQEFGKWYKEYKTHGHGKPIEPQHDFDFQHCGILTSVDSDEPVQPAFRLRNSK